jgi:putative ABC transport system permease protein
MNVFTRGIRNAFRNGIRTLSIVAILGLSIGLSLTMLVANKAVGNKIATVKSSIGNTISIAPAGVQGFEGGGNPLTQASVDTLKSLAHVSSISESINDRLTSSGDSSNTNLVSSIDAGSLGQRFGREGGFGGGFGGGASGSTAGQAQTFTIPVTATGVSDTSQYAGSAVKLTSGSQIDGTADKPVALIGKDLATKNNLTVGSTFTAYGSAITVSGIFDTGTSFSNNAVIFSLPTLQRLSSQVGDITSATATVDSISNMDSVTAAVKSKLGSTADVTSSKDQAANAIAPLDSVKTISVFSLVGAVVAGAVIILLTMVMVVRERKREIGVTKAIGGSNLSIISQFMVEALTLTILGAVVGLVIGVIGGQPVTKLLVSNSTTSATTTATPGQRGSFGGGSGFGGGQSTGGGGITRRGGFGGALGRNSAVKGISNIKTQVGPGILLDGFGAAIFIALVGSALAAGMIAKVRPSEVMRAE